MTFRIIDLFSGAGGLSLGFARQGGDAFKSILALDSDETATATYKANFDCRTLNENIEDWVVSGEIPQADLVIGGPPCQGFSLLNKKRNGDERRALWEPYLDAVRKSGARMFVMENVAELFRSQELKDIRNRARAMGFSTIADVLNAADFGTPQIRRRTVVIGWDQNRVLGNAHLPNATHFSPDKVPIGGKVWRTVRDAISGLPARTNGTEIGEDPVLGLHFGRNPTSLSQERYRNVPEGGNRFDLQRNAEHLTPACWIRKRSGGTDLFGRLWWDRPSTTIRTEFFKPEKGRYLHPVEHRPISHREAARLMGFPDSFRFVGSKIKIARQIGNAVPPDLSEAIAREVLAVLSHDPGMEVQAVAGHIEAA